MGRSGHATVVDNARQGLWLEDTQHRTHTRPAAHREAGTESGDSGGAGGGVGFVPTGYPFYNFTTGYWEEKMPSECNLYAVSMHDQ